jgi:hypothetical protein
VSLRTGNVNWVLGGKDSTFTEQAAPGQTLDSAGEIFAWQHDPEQVGPHTFTWFDDDAAPSELPYSRTVTVQLNFRNKTATLVSSDNQPGELSAGAEGNAQTTLNGDQFVGWGTLPYISEFSPSGQLLFNAQFPAGVNTYRAYRLPWPARGPGIVRGGSGARNPAAVESEWYPGGQVDGGGWLGGEVLGGEDHQV